MHVTWIRGPDSIDGSASFMHPRSVFSVVLVRHVESGAGLVVDSIYCRIEYVLPCCSAFDEFVSLIKGSACLDRDAEEAHKNGKGGVELHIEANRAR